MYNIQSICVLQYLSKICPPTRDQTSQYSLRNSQNILPIFCKYACFKRSFFPFTINLWNSLDLGVRQSSTMNMFKKKLSETLLSKHNKLLSSFHGRGSINHTRIRLGLSALNAHRASYGFIDFSQGPKCGAEVEDTKHFLFDCTYYAAQREELFARVALITGHDHYALQIENLSRSNMLLKSKFMLYGHPILTLHKILQYSN